MTNLITRWRTEQQEAFEREQLRQAYLRGRLPKNPPELLAATNVLVKKAFYMGGGKLAEVGQVVTVEKNVADSMIALRKAELA